MTIIECIDRNGNKNDFQYSYEVDNSNNKIVWKFTIIPITGNFQDFFFFSAVEINNSTLKITMINHHNQKVYIAKGIPERIIIELQKKSSKNIVSSSNNPSFKSLSEEYRTPSATKVWERLVRSKMATYNTEKDIYILEKMAHNLAQIKKS